MKSEEFVYGEADDYTEDAEGNNNEELKSVDYKKLRKKHISARRRGKHIFLKVFLVLFLILCAFLTPVFNVNKIVVVGNSILSEEKIIDASGIYLSKNIFTFQCSKAKDEIEKLSFVDICEVERELPSEVVINIKECVPIAQIKCGQSLFLIVDKSGKVLDISDNRKKYDIPELDNISVIEFEVGKKVNPENTSTFNNMLLLAQEVKNSGVSEMTESLTCKDDELIICLKGDIKCNIGNGENMPYRVKFIREVYESIPEGKKGTLKFVEEYKAVFTEDEKSDKS